MKEAMAELKAQQDEAVREWNARRQKAGITRWTDKDALRQLRTAVARAMLTDDWIDVARAVREAAADPFASPWKVPQLAADLGSRRREQEHVEQKLRERAEGYRLGT